MSETYALVTGASSGIGLEISYILAQKGYNLLLVSNEEERLLTLKTEISERYSVATEVLFMDLARNSAAQEVYDYCIDNKLQIEVLINNAGFFFFSEVVEADIIKSEQKIVLHVLTSSLLCTLFGKQMKEKGKGYIMNTGSVSAYKSFPGIAHYGATKSYIKYFTRSLRTEMKPYGVHVCCLSPGATVTNLYDPNVIDIEKGKKFGIMMSARKVAESGVRGLFANKSLVIPGWMTVLMLLFTIPIPQFIITLVWKKFRSRLLPTKKSL